jgi:hypothetical protein
LQNPRNAQPVIQRNYTTAAGFAEPWWLISVTYYNDIVSGGVVNPSLYLDKFIRWVGGWVAPLNL